MTTEANQVLIVDDDEAIRETLEDVLRDEGFSVAAAENGKIALGYLADNPLPRVIILDLMMPVMSGEEFRERQLAEPRLAGIPVILMSASDRGSAVAAKMAANDFLSKPTSMDALLKSVAKYC